MKTFQLYDDQLINVWHRTYYTIEAETIEEAAKLIKEEDADTADECEILYETEVNVNSCDNNGDATREIYNKDTGELIWDNTMK